MANEALQIKTYYPLFAVLSIIPAQIIMGNAPNELEKLVEIAKIQSTEASNAIEGIVSIPCGILHLNRTVWDSTRAKSRQTAAALGTLWQQHCSVQ